VPSRSADRAASGGSQGDPSLIRALGEPDMYPGRPSVTVHETHASWVFLAGDHAYKVKKPVALGFLDYSTLARRRGACLEEVRVNQELAPGLYLGVRAIVESARGLRLAPGEDPTAVEYVVEMLRFRARDTFAGLIEAGTLAPADVVAAARVLGEFHSRAQVVEDWGPERVLDVWRRNVRELQGIEHPSGWRVDVAAGFGEAFVRAHEPELRRRALDGLARDGHGDLRCEHVLARPEIRVVDRIEFDARLRRTDVAADLAFLAMDLEAHGQRWAARELYEAYGESGPSLGDESLRSFYAAHWAIVRAKVALILASERDEPANAADLRLAEQLWCLSERLCWRARRPLAIVICGPAASGKSVLAEELSRRSELPIVSSDAVRKRLAHLAPSQSASAEHYSAEFTRATYEQLTRDALDALRGERGVLVDATCRSRADRGPLLSALRAAGARLLIVRCEVPLELALRRATERLRDPRRVSDATPEIAERQFRDFEELDGRSEGCALRLDTSGTSDLQVAAVARAADRDP
jgi:aminoglycoside phosphotransferase family enzyme/predicted kinase